MIPERSQDILTVAAIVLVGSVVFFALGMRHRQIEREWQRLKRKARGL